MQEHAQKHVKKLEFDCDICGKIFTTTYAIRSHKIIHLSKPKLIKTDVNVEEFSIEKEIQEHVKNEIYTKIDDCKELSPNELTEDSEINLTKPTESAAEKRIIAHLADHENLPVPKTKCSYCGKQISITHIKRHRMEHENSVKMHRCGECSYETSTLRNLKDHIGAHHENIVHKCSQCDYEAKFKKTLMKHIRRKHA